jgi:CspA family cold shock protein
MVNVDQLAMPGRRVVAEAVPIVEAAQASGPRGLARGEGEALPRFDQSSASADPLTEGLTVEAAVKWFNADKGYGFVELAGGRGDAFLHLKTLREIGRETLPSGARVRAVIRAGSRGSQVVRVIEIDTTSAVERPARSSRRPTPDPSAAFDLTGKVKWFDSARGFGFVASDDFGRDVFVHNSTLAASGFAGLLDGQAVSMRVVETPKGREAITISA